MVYLGLNMGEEQNMDRLADIFDEGVRAYTEGVVKNQYEPKTPEGDAWDNGWWDAEQAQSANYIGR